MIFIIDKFLFYLSEPINVKLIIEIKERNQVTASHLLEKFNEIPQATLYRYLQKMLEDGVLKVVGKNQTIGKQIRKRKHRDNQCKRIKK